MGCGGNEGQGANGAVGRKEGGATPWRVGRGDGEGDEGGWHGLAWHWALKSHRAIATPTHRNVPRQLLGL